jgi:hypothetical protein
MAVWRLMGMLTSCALAMGATCGCSIGLGADSVPADLGPDTGTITVDWLVMGADDPSLCAMYGADDIEIVLYDESGDQAATATAPCGSFSTTVTLAEGTYTADVTLVDSDSNAITTTKGLTALDVVAGTDLAVSLDFPSSSVL